MSTSPNKQLLGTLHLSRISRKRIRTHRSNTDPTHQGVGIRYYSEPILTNTEYTSLRFRGDVCPHSVHQPCCGRVGSYARRPPVAIKSERLHRCRVSHFSNTPESELEATPHYPKANLKVTLNYPSHTQRHNMANRRQRHK